MVDRFPLATHACRSRKAIQGGIMYGEDLFDGIFLGTPSFMTVLMYSWLIQPRNSGT